MGKRGYWTKEQNKSETTKSGLLEPERLRGHYAVTTRSLRSHYAVTTRLRGHYGRYAVTTRTLRGQKELHVRG